ncbi:MAG: DUF1080 domain-containing protein [Cyclobacteriaceae bacterium]|nr:DUF1080 domain-containing protein [Cyclobacteriaceae bacterium]
MKKTIFLLPLLAFCGLFYCISAQDEMKPEDTEVWEPEPVKIDPGESAASPPSDAIILFNGQDMSAFNIPEGTEWVVGNGMVTISPSEEKRETPVVITTKQEFGDIQLHVEWRSPAEVRGEGQRRGNSGIFLQQRYEIQVLDNYNNRTYSNGQAASVYKQQIPLVNACRPPGEWQTYGIIYTAPRFTEAGELESPAYVTVMHNGVLVQNHTEILGPIKFIGYPEYEPHPLKQPLGLQDHGDAVSYRNIWVREL